MVRDKKHIDTYGCGADAERGPVFIMGYMACGKTTFGRALARATRRDFIDLDYRIEQRFHKTVGELFAERGEEGFREIEANMLREVAEMENVVVSCGGGTPCFHNNMDVMLACGPTVWLQASPARIAERLSRNRARRPLMADKAPEELLDAVTGGIESRRQHYERARIRFNGDSLEDKSQIAGSVADFLDRYPFLRNDVK